MSNKPRSGKPPARRVGKKASNSNKNGSFSVDLPSLKSRPSFEAEDSAGIDIDFPDLLDRIKNGNQFEEGGRVEAFTVEDRLPEGFGPEHKGNVKISLFNIEAYPHSEFGGGAEIGTFEFGADGVGIGAKVGAYSGIAQAGPLDVKVSGFEANAGAKLLDDKGIDAKFEFSVNLASATIGPIGLNLGGISADTGVKIGKEGVGLKFLGTGFEIGRRTEVSLSLPVFGSVSFGFTLW